MCVISKDQFNSNFAYLRIYTYRKKLMSKDIWLVYVDIDINAYCMYR